MGAARRRGRGINESGEGMNIKQLDKIVFCLLMKGEGQLDWEKKKRHSQRGNEKWLKEEIVGIC